MYGLFFLVLAGIILYAQIAAEREFQERNKKK